MVQLKLTLKSKRPSTVYSANGKSYRLLPGSNVLNLEYEDYLALAKALSIKPVQKEEHHEDPVKEEPAEEIPKEIHEESHEESNEEPAEESHEESNEEINEEPVEESHEESHEESNEEINEEPVEESHEESNEEINEEPVEESNSNDDYSSWSYSELKAEYKNVTGKSCKLKKEEIINFLQENKDNVE